MMPSPSTEDFAALFPPFPRVVAKWCPIFFEPVRHSGERLIVAVAAVDALGSFEVLETVGGKQAKCMYGAQAERFSGLVSIAVTSLRAHLANGRGFEEWASPMGPSVVLGDLREAICDGALDAARTGASLVSSLVMAAESLSLAQSAGDIDEATTPTAKIETQVRQSVLGLRREWAPRFNATVRANPGAAPTHIGYLGLRLAANFDQLTPDRNVKRARDRAKAGLINLMILKERTSDFTGPHCELMLLRSPRRNEAKLQQLRDVDEAFAELESFADHHQIVVRSLESVDEAASRIVRAETELPA